MKNVIKKVTVNFPKKANEQLDTVQDPNKEAVLERFDKEFDINPEGLSKNSIEKDKSFDLNKNK